jgi:hypothetical protein
MAPSNWSHGSLAVLTMERAMRKFSAIVRLTREIVMLGIVLTKAVLLIIEILGKATNWFFRCCSISRTISFATVR